MPNKCQYCQWSPHPEHPRAPSFLIIASLSVFPAYPDPVPRCCVKWRGWKVYLAWILVHGEVKAASVELLLSVCRQVAPVNSLRTESRLLSHALCVGSSQSNQWAFPLHAGPQSGTRVLWLDSLVLQGDSSPVWAFSLFYMPLRNNQSYDYFPSCKLCGNLSCAYICIRVLSVWR